MEQEQSSQITAQEVASLVILAREFVGSVGAKLSSKDSLAIWNLIATVETKLESLKKESNE